MECPVCSAQFPAEEIESHVNRCLEGGGDGSAAAAVGGGDDEAFALALQQQLNEEASEPRKYACAKCSKEADIESLYSLDLCSHRFCRPCLEEYFTQALEEKLATEVCCPQCGEAVSVRDLQDFTRAQKPKRGRAPAARGVSAGGGAHRRLMKELRALSKADKDVRRHKVATAHWLSQGICAEMVGDDLFCWQVQFFDFEDSSALQKDLKKKAVTLEVQFPGDFPHLPPYIRVLRPRFQFRTGHVTIGGSICTEMLTTTGWDPSMTMESVLMSIRTNMVTGGARIDLSNKRDYTEAEAKDAFNRMKQQHGW